AGVEIVDEDWLQDKTQGDDPDTDDGDPYGGQDKEKTSRDDSKQRSHSHDKDGDDDDGDVNNDTPADPSPVASPIVLLPAVPTVPSVPTSPPSPSADVDIHNNDDANTNGADADT